MKIWRPPAVAIIQINALSPSATGKSRGEVKVSIFGSIVLLSKIERALLQGVNVAHHQNGDEAKHAPEDHAAVRNRFFVNDRPRIHEHDLEVEQDEEHGHEIKLHAKAGLSLPLWNHAALRSEERRVGKGSSVRG